LLHLAFIRKLFFFFYIFLRSFLKKNEKYIKNENELKNFKINQNFFFLIFKSEKNYKKIYIKSGKGKSTIFTIRIFLSILIKRKKSSNKIKNKKSRIKNQKNKSWKHKMGVYLSEPNKNKSTESGSSDYIKYAASSMQGFPFFNKDFQ